MGQNRDRDPNQSGDHDRRDVDSLTLASVTLLGVPIESQALRGLDSLLSIVQMPAGIPVATFAIGRAGAVNAALFAAAMLGLADPAAAAAVEEWRRTQAAAIPDRPQTQ